MPRKGTGGPSAAPAPGLASTRALRIPARVHRRPRRAERLALDLASSDAPLVLPRYGLTAARVERLVPGGRAWPRPSTHVEVVLRKQHYLQACAQLSVFVYWGWYWRAGLRVAPT